MIAKTTLGVSIWVEVLLDKYFSHRPTYRLLKHWQSVGLDLPSGCDGYLVYSVTLLSPIPMAKEITSVASRVFAVVSSLASIQ